MENKLPCRIFKASCIYSDDTNTLVPTVKVAGYSENFAIMEEASLNVQAHEDAVKPEDSASQMGSTTSTAASARARAAARKASLVTQHKAFAQQQELERKIFEL